MAVTHTDRVGTPLEQSYVLLRDAERVELDIGALGLDKRTPHRGEVLLLLTANFRFQLLPRPDGVIYGVRLGDNCVDRGLQLLLTTQRVQVGYEDGGCPIFAIKVTGRLCLHPDEFCGFSSGAAYRIEEDIHEGQIPWLVNNVGEFRDREKSLSDLLTLGLEPMTSRLEKGGAAGWL